MSTITTRRTQAERSATTRVALLDAAAGCLADRGYAGTTIAAVAERAGVSSGAVFHHFADKSDLMVGTAEHMSARDHDRFVAKLRPQDGLHRTLEFMVDAAFEELTNPSAIAHIELNTAARTDSRLASGLDALHEQEGNKHVAMMGDYLSGEVDVDPERLRPVIELIVFAIEGLFANVLSTHEVKRERLRVTLKQVVDAFADEVAGER